jgi:hypothetical protein
VPGRDRCVVRAGLGACEDRGGILAAVGIGDHADLALRYRECHSVKMFWSKAEKCVESEATAVVPSPHSAARSARTGGAGYVAAAIWRGEMAP